MDLKRETKGMKFSAVREGNPPIPPVIDCDDHDSASNVAPQFRPHQSKALRKRHIYQLDRYTRRIVHNHPSGDPAPSRADIDITRAIIAAGKPLNIAVHDHLIVGLNGQVSLRAKGLI